MNKWRRSDETGLSKRKKLMEMRARLMLIVDEGGIEGRGSAGGSNSDSGSGGVSSFDSTGIFYFRAECDSSCSE